ncbi:MAG: DUF922 domain-containing protein [Planctomycetota bacterium]
MTVNLANLGTSRESYSFRAANLAEALRQLDRLGPKDGDGHHAAVVTYKADLMQSLRTKLQARAVRQGRQYYAEAVIGQATLRYGFVFLMPAWSNVSSASRSAQAEWKRYLGCLETHERGHLTCVQNLYPECQAQLRALRIAGTGSSASAAESAAQTQLRAQAQSLFDYLVYQVQGSSDAYDRRTRHGRTQGAQLNVGAEVKNDCGAPNCPGHSSSSHRCNTGVKNPCGKAGCPGHASPNDRCGWW